MPHLFAICTRHIIIANILYTERHLQLPIVMSRRRRREDAAWRRLSGIRMRGLQRLLDALATPSSFLRIRYQPPSSAAAIASHICCLLPVRRLLLRVGLSLSKSSLTICAAVSTAAYSNLAVSLMFGVGVTNRTKHGIVPHRPVSLQSCQKARVVQGCEAG